jgi:hypothetical protein
MNKFDWKKRLRELRAEGLKKSVLSPFVSSKSEDNLENYNHIDLLSPFVSSYSGDVSKYFQNVFDYNWQAGSDFIKQVIKNVDRTKELRFLTNPTVEAFNIEVALVDGIIRRESNEISQEHLDRIINQYFQIHSVDYDITKDWTDKNIPLVYLQIYENRDEMESFTCNPIQANIVTEFYLSTIPEVTILITKI